MLSLLTRIGAVSKSSRRPDGRAQAGKGESGQALVEFALMAIILMVLLGFTLDIARSYYSFQVIKDAAGEGAYYGSVHPTWTQQNQPCDNPHNITYRVQHAAPPGGLVDLTTANVGIFVDNTPVAGDLISVTVTVNYRLVAPFTGAFIGSQTLPLTATSSARILAPADSDPANCP